MKYYYALALVPFVLEQLREARIFTKLDMCLQLHDNEWDEWKIAFSSTSGHCEYCIMAYRLSYAPTVFQHLIYEMLRDMLGKFVLAHIDLNLTTIPGSP